MDPSYIIGIIGPIASGKTTLATKLSDHFKWPMLREPVVENPFLKKFYDAVGSGELKRIKKYAMLSQNSFYSSLFLVHDECTAKEVICDSTVVSNLVFSEQMRRQGYMTATEFALTGMIAEKHIENLRPTNLYVVLKRSRNQLEKNLAIRGREFELGKDEYMDFHFKTYYENLDVVFKWLNVPATHILEIEITDMHNPEEWENIRRKIEERFVLATFS